MAMDTRNNLGITKTLIFALFVYYGVVMIGTLAGLLFFFHTKVVTENIEAIPI